MLVHLECGHRAVLCAPSNLVSNESYFETSNANSIFRQLHNCIYAHKGVHATAETQLSFLFESQFLYIRDIWFERQKRGCIIHT